MRYMIIVRATPMSEAGVMPEDPKLLQDMADYHEELARAGVLLDGSGLRPSSEGWRIGWAGRGKPVLTDGPFAETKELIAGYWLWKCRSKEDAISWVKRCPNPMPGEDSEIEIRQVFEAEDFGAEFTPELKAQEERLRAQIAEKP